LENQPAEARRYLDKIGEAEVSMDALSQPMAGALAELGDVEAAQSLLEAALKIDPENALVHAQLAGMHCRAGRFEEAIAAAAESLSLLYFQPGIHGLLGQALMETGRFAEAEQELRVAVSQSPRNLAAHELLARLYRQHLNRPDEAFGHEGRAMSLRHELAAQRRAATGAQTSIPLPARAAVESGAAGSSGLLSPALSSKGGEGEATAASLGKGSNSRAVVSAMPAVFGPEVDQHKIITVVSGLPRSGTSMMMQLLVAAGREALTDNKRAADEDNQLGYFEFEKTLELAKDVSWLPQARGKVVKIVAQLLPYLPRDEHYNVIFMERDLAEVIASQKAMLARQGRRGADLEEQQLVATYTSQLRRIQAQLERRPEIRSLRMNYGELVANPAREVVRLASFMGEPFDSQGALRAVNPQLRRQKTLQGL
jgi:tetratricopeptide (TPR) repeat protein